MKQKTITLSDGCLFTGYIDENGIRNGTGIKTYPNGATFKGTWINDVRHGEGIKTWSNGNQINVIYNNGKLIKSY